MDFVDYYETRDKLHREMGWLIPPGLQKKHLIKMLSATEAPVDIRFLVKQSIELLEASTKTITKRHRNAFKDAIRRTYGLIGEINEAVAFKSASEEDIRNLAETAKILMDQGKANLWKKNIEYIIEYPMENIVLFDPYDELDYPMGNASFMVVVNVVTNAVYDKICFYEREKSLERPCYKVYEDPENYAHPYIRYGTCYGEMQTVFNKAKKAGDMISMADITEGVMRHYSTGNPFWRFSKPKICIVCGERADDVCYKCSTRFCEEHSITCEVCNRHACLSHSATCSCGKKICNECSVILRIDGKRGAYCPDCIGMCSGCGATMPMDRMVSHREETLCASCMRLSVFDDVKMASENLEGNERLNLWKKALEDKAMELLGVASISEVCFEWDEWR